MKYFLDTEFIEGTQKKFFGETKPTIDLISIGLVDENGREYYAISKDFNLKEAWNRHDLVVNKQFPQDPEYFKKYWIRDNVLRPIFDELRQHQGWGEDRYVGRDEFNYRNLKQLIELYGVSLRGIANGICAFIYGDDCGGSGMSAIEMAMKYEISDKTKEPEFYAYYAGYDWVAFCWIFGKMMQLPKGFPMYCKDLKQIMDEKGLDKEWKRLNCPDPVGEHNALVDAKWNLKLFNLLKV